MLSIIPCLEVLKAVTDKNISGSAAQSRVEAFSAAIDLKSISGGADIILEGKLYERVKQRLEPDHEVFFFGSCRIDNSATGLSTYDVLGAIKWIAASEGKTRKTIILGENQSDYGSILNENIICVKPADFVYKVKRAKELFEKRQYTLFQDALTAVFFPA